MRRGAPPLPGNNPLFASGKATMPSSVRIARSAASSISAPPPTTFPLAARMIGFFQSLRVMAPVPQVSLPLGGWSVFSLYSLRSAPAQNTLPVLVKMATLASSSSSKSSKASHNSAHIAELIALRASGRSSVMMNAPSFFSMLRYSNVGICSIWSPVFLKP